MSKRQHRAATSRVTLQTRLLSWWEHNIGCLGESLLRIFRTPLASLLTMAVLGIALALPGGLFMLTQNLLSLSGNWDTGTRITLYLQETITDEEGQRLALELQDTNEYLAVEYLDRTQALEEFRRMAHLDDALEKLETNPLPPVILLKPGSGLDSRQLERLVNRLGKRPEIELAQLDLQWVQRLQGIIRLIQHALVIIFALLAIAVVLVVGNTIRLEIESRRDEIVITRLFGATHAYIRRPFLYDGFWFGLFGGVFASLIVIAALWTLSEPTTSLIALYGSKFLPVYPGPFFIVGMVMLGALLGYLGAWSAVSQHLSRIEPT